MLGWEFPPHISGGLGTACYGMTKALDEIGVEVCFVLPTAIPLDTSAHVQLRSPSDVNPVEVEDSSHIFEHVELHKVDAVLQPYGTPQTFENAVRAIEAQQRADDGQTGDDNSDTDDIPGALLPQGSFRLGAGEHYDGDLLGQVRRYARMAVSLARKETFDVIHAHDWMTYPAGAAVANISRKPLIVHVHSTEFDRAGENVNLRICDIERGSMRRADCVVCVSHLTARIVSSRYGVPDEKIRVVYNAVELPQNGSWEMKPIRQNEKIVLFLGRLTLQKGPEYFLHAAKKVVEKFPNVRFVMAGSGDMVRRCVQLAADLNLGRYVTFTGFLRGPDVDKIFSLADLYVMPSVSEPFGIAPLEAMSHNVPVIISKQSGVSEVLTHVLKVDFWDVDEMANKILGVLRHEPLRKTLKQHGHIELRKLSWLDSAKSLREIYRKLTKV